MEKTAFQGHNRLDFLKMYNVRKSDEIEGDDEEKEPSS